MRRIIYTLLASSFPQAFSDCLDINGRSIAQDLHYVPGPDACTLCICEQDSPKLCKAVLCAPPPDCQSFTRVGKSCCNFTCNDALHKREELGGDMGLRLFLFSAVTAILCLSLIFFFVHRLRQRKTIGSRSRAMRAEHRNMGNIGYITSGLSYLPENYFAGPDGFDRHIEFHYEEPPSQLSLWKPPGHGTAFYPRGEAPPPYEIAVAQPRAELTITASSTLPNISHRTIPLNLTAPGTIRIIHPHQRRSVEAGVATTLPRVPGKPHDAPTGTLQINISSCGFHNSLRQSEDTSLQSAEVALLTHSADGAVATISAEAVYGEMEDLPIEMVAIPPPSPQRFESEVVRAAPKDMPYADAESYVELNDEMDDYRSECENCKSSPGGQGYYPEGEAETPETMTLQRLPKDSEEEQFYRTSVTLPAHCRKPRRILGSRESWFSAMPESSSEED